MKEFGCGEPQCGCGGNSRLSSNGTLRPSDSQCGPGLFSRTASSEIDPRGLAVGPYYQPPTFDPRKLLFRPTEPTRTMEDIVRRGYPGLRGIDPSRLVVGGNRKLPFVLTANGRLEVPMQSGQGLVLASMILTLALQGPNPEELELAGLEGFGSLQFMSCAREDCKGSLALRVERSALSDPCALWQKGVHLEIDVPAHLIWTTCSCFGLREVVSQAIQFGMQFEAPGLELVRATEGPHSTGLLASIRMSPSGEVTSALTSEGTAQARHDFSGRISPFLRTPSLDKVSVALKAFRGFGSYQRRVVLQPIFLKDSRVDDRDPDTELFQRALVHAHQVWKKAGVTFVSLPPVVVDFSGPMRPAGLPNDASVHFVREGNPPPPPGERANAELLDSLEAFMQRDGQHRIYFFRSVATTEHARQFYGTTEPNTGDAHAFVVTSQEYTDLDGLHKYHLAHELGHVLGIYHPDPDPSHRPPTALGVKGSTGTIMCSADRERPVETNTDRMRNSLWHKVNVKNSIFIFIPLGRLEGPAPFLDCCHGQGDGMPPDGCNNLRDCPAVCAIVSR